MPNLKNCIQKQFETLNINIHKFNYANIALIIIASIMASIALLTDNYQTIIASKIIGLAIVPFISLCIMIIAGSRLEVLQSATSCLIFIGLCLAVSGMIGFVNQMIQWKEQPTNEMLTRANFKYDNIRLELVMSAVAGVGMYYAIIKTSTVALIGLILAISIIPPLCNAGLFWGMHTFEILGQFRNQEIANQEIANQEIANQEIANQEIANQKEKESENKNYLEYGKHSFVIFASNITGMVVGFMAAFSASCIF